MEPAVYTPSKPVPTEPISFEKFIEWLDEDTHAEWVDGKVVLKMPVPVKHQYKQRYVVKLLGGCSKNQGAGNKRAHTQVRPYTDL